MELTDPIRVIPTLGPRYEKKCHALGITTIRDLLLYFPMRYEDLSNIVPIAALKNDERATIRATVVAIENRRAFRKSMVLTEALLRDDSGEVKAVWFRQVYLPKTLPPGTTAWFSGILKMGRYGPHLANPVYEMRDEGMVHTARIAPMYSTRDRITQKQIRALIHAALPVLPALHDPIPDPIKSTEQLMDRNDAVRILHFPDSFAALVRARARMAFEELFVLHCRMQRLLQERNRDTAPTIPFDAEQTKRLVAALPFTLTDDQRRSAWAILGDLAHPDARPMYRLLGGDVGSGKTVVAALAAANVAWAGAQTFFMAPTALLAEQHFGTLGAFFTHDNFSVALMTRERRAITDHGVTRDVTRAALKKELLVGRVRLVVGTHALIADATLPRDALALVVVDEQHRFGVEQRAALRDVRKDGSIPHFLSMTATPIPRTLALTLFADLAHSELRMMPHGRIPVKTFVVPEVKREGAYTFIKKELDAGRQAFVICPLIDPSDTLGVRAATDEYARLSESIFSAYRVGLLHGRVSQKERDATMRAFQKGEIHLLIATSVIEVGIDIPNATIMMIEGAERFGLAQLHQFRGRVGRGVHPSFCFLFAETDEETALARLKALTDTTDGFALAERDLAFRGPGELLGTTQSGFFDFRFASFGDTEPIKRARAAAEAIFAQDPELKTAPELGAILAVDDAVHGE